VRGVRVEGLNIQQRLNQLLSNVETPIFLLKTYHEARCMYGEPAAGLDMYSLPLYNGHGIQGTQFGYGFPSSFAFLTSQVGNNGALLLVWYSADTMLYYGINLTVVGPAGVPYYSAW
jgi:hypothetical protein